MATTVELSDSTMRAYSGFGMLSDPEIATGEVP
jgi:hypothetical protein